MIITMSANGTLVTTVPERVYQGSDKANQLIVVSPLARTCTLSVTYKLPQSGTYTEAQVMTLATNIPTTIGFNAWSIDLTSAVTQYYGTAYFQIKASTGTSTIASGSGSFEIEKGVPPVTTSSGSTYTQVLNALTQIQTDITNIEGDIADIQADVEDLQDDVETLQGQQDDYVLKTSISSTISSTSTNAEVAGAKAVYDYVSAREVVGFVKVTTLPEVGEANKIYLVPITSPQTGNIYKEYIYIDNAWEIIGTTEIDLTSKQDVIVSVSLTGSSGTIGATDLAKLNASNENYIILQGTQIFKLKQKSTTLIYENSLNYATSYISVNATTGAWALGGSNMQKELTAGNGIDITSDTISVDTDEVQAKLTAGSNITISNNTINANVSSQAFTSLGDLYTKISAIDTAGGKLLYVDFGNSNTSLGSFTANQMEQTVSGNAFSTTSTTINLSGVFNVDFSYVSATSKSVTLVKYYSSVYEVSNVTYQFNTTTSVILASSVSKYFYNGKTLKTAVGLAEIDETIGSTDITRTATINGTIYYIN